MFNERNWTIKCDNCQKDRVYLKMYMETAKGTNQLILEHVTECPNCNFENNDFKK